MLVRLFIFVLLLISFRANHCESGNERTNEFKCRVLIAYAVNGGHCNFDNKNYNSKSIVLTECMFSIFCDFLVVCHSATEFVHCYV